MVGSRSHMSLETEAFFESKKKEYGDVEVMAVGSSLKMILFDDLVYDESILINYIIGFFAALISGYYACKWMIFFVRKSKLKYFALYCFIVGISSILYSIF